VKIVAEFDQIELACRIAEGCLGIKRPKNATAQQALNEFNLDSRIGFLKAAENAMRYMQEELNRSGKVN